MKTSHKWLCRVWDGLDNCYFYLANYDVLPYFRWVEENGIDHPAIQFESYLSAFNALELFYNHNSSSRFYSLVVVSPETKTKVLDFALYQDLRNNNQWHLLNKELDFE